MRLQDRSLRTKLLGGFALVLLIAAFVVLFAILKLKHVNEVTSEIAAQRLPAVALTGDINASTGDFRTAQFEHIVTSKPEKMDQLEKTMARALETLDKHRQRYITLIGDEQERQLWQRFESEWAQYLSVQAQLLKLSRGLQTAEAEALLEGEVAKGFHRSNDTLDELIRLNQQRADQARKDAAALYDSARVTLVLALIVMAAAGGAIGGLLSQRLSRDIGAAQRAVEAIAAGDLTGEIQPGGQDEVGRMMSALASMQDRLAGIVAGVRSNAESVAGASGEIAQGNADLSQRTEEQASALQQTAATMDELSSTVRNNAGNAQQANQLAQGASTVAAQGGAVVAQVVQTMRGINESSRQIADIVGVIDSIAFQTNILALNAAVEAARAGEQGRGFAVVAGEVRTLAQRSATAAREIKALIGTSVDRVEAGSAQVDQAGATMTEVVEAIRRVSDIVGEISSASGEQASGIGQVGDAITQMDKVTQQNAALVEEGAAAAMSLRDQADALVRSVAIFKLSH
ncbi:methyl-accepting chemotaxis protein [Pelomonas sp. KK5]|uniref:methyl-accepting chemotaxis protein n=1 Tax=Pelomonas sp. KK5 TaxID=1855730 RepID=UPI00097C627A|nr:methyl-accepting chemotaxis protein [Pelomonas sp. KK5]